jgi:hypothetical protein
MKGLRLFLIVLAAPATVLLGLHEIGSTPISKGYDTGFQWRAEPSSGRLILSAEAGGNMTCWIKLKIPTTSSRLTAETSAKVSLQVSVQPVDQRYEWIKITKSSATPEEMFDWPSGATLSIDFQDRPPDLKIADWYIFLNNKNPDSNDWSRRRRILFVMSLVLLVLSLAGVILEAIEKYGAKRVPFSPQRCMELLIGGIEGVNDQESERMKMILGKVLLEGATVPEALAPLKLSWIDQQTLWFKTRRQFRSRLQFLIDQLNKSLSDLSRPG